MAEDTTARTHEDDEYPTDEFDRYIPYDGCGWSACPWCGESIHPTDEVLTVGGCRGLDISFCNPENGGHPNVRTYHPRCWQKRQVVKHRVRNRTLDDYAQA